MPRGKKRSQEEIAAEFDKKIKAKEEAIEKKQAAIDQAKDDIKKLKADISKLKKKQEEALKPKQKKRKLSYTRVLNLAKEKGIAPEEIAKQFKLVVEENSDIGSSKTTEITTAVD